MIVVANSSPLIVLARINQLKVFKHLFGKVYVPDSVYKETVLNTKLDIQRQAISKAIDKDFIEVVTPKKNYIFEKKLHEGEKGVLNLALDKSPDYMIIDDNNARNEAKKLGFEDVLILTTDILKFAEEKRIINSYSGIMSQLAKLMIYPPEEDKID